MILVKIGGSVITDKNLYRRFREDSCKKIIRVLPSLNDDLIVTHGAGSFGHIIAKRSGFPRKFKKEDVHDYSIIHRDVLDLNDMVAGIMLEEGFSPLSIPTQSIYRNRSPDLSDFQKYMSLGFTPVGMGDVILRSGIVKIISADDLLVALSAAFKPNLVIFLTDVDGIYDNDPKTFSDAKLLKSIDRNIAFSHVMNDVTGGMKSKYEKILKIRKHAGEVVVVNGNKPERLNDIGKKDFIGTVI
ncbi:MAG: isopentenyl phosphate kinase [Candidatus Thermoplasmatota archaeon]|nr:isopentenyl phosphate kinase [Candidatus Thermoplasmatota archaeon]